MIPNDDKNSQIEVDFFIVKVYAHNLHQKLTSKQGFEYYTGYIKKCGPKCGPIRID